MKLLILKANQLGDNIVFLPVVQELVSRLGASAVTVLTSPSAAGLYDGLLPESSLWVESTDVVLGAWRKPLKLAALASKSRDVQADAALVAFDQGNVSRLLAWTSGARLRVGVEHPSTRTNGCLTHRLGFDPEEAAAVRDWTAMRLMLDFLGVVSRERVATLPPRPSMKHLFPDRRTPERNRKRIFFHSGASQEYKRWPGPRLVELAGRLSDRYEVMWSVTAEQPKGPEGLAEKVTRVPQGSLADLVTTLAGCGMFVGNNSGPMNAAVAVGTPTLIFNGPSPYSWDPVWDRERHRLLRVEGLACQPCESVLGPSNRCTNVHEPMACMNRWTVDVAEEEVEAHYDNVWNEAKVSRKDVDAFAQVSSAAPSIPALAL